MIDRWVFIYDHDYEFQMVFDVGTARHAFAYGNNCEPRPGASEDDPENPIYHRRGSLGEFSCSQICNLSWRPCVGIFDETDVGGCIEVKTVTRRSDHLIVEASKLKDNLIYVLMLQEHWKRYRLIGWLLGRELHRFQQQKRGDTFWIPSQVPNVLHSPADLIRILNERYHRPTAADRTGAVPDGKIPGVDPRPENPDQGFRP